MNESDRTKLQRKTAKAAIEALTIIAGSLSETERPSERTKEAFASAIRGVASALQEVFSST